MLGPLRVSDPLRGASFRAPAARGAGSPQGCLFPSEELSHLKGTSPTAGTGGGIPIPFRDARCSQRCRFPSGHRQPGVPDALRDAASLCNIGLPVPFRGE